MLANHVFYNVLIETYKCLINNKIDKILLAISLQKIYIVDLCFAIGNIALNVGYFFPLLHICMFQLKRCKKQD